MSRVKVISVKFTHEEFNTFKGVMRALNVTRSELVRALVAGILATHGVEPKDEKIMRASEKVFSSIPFDRFVDELSSALTVPYVSGGDLRS